MSKWMHAYNEVYLDDAIGNLGESFDYAAYACHTELDLICLWTCL